MRRAARVDENQDDIVKAMRAVGASVHVIKEPIDLMVGFRKRTIAMEVKNPDKDWRLTDQQEEFFREFRGEAYIVENVAQAIAALNKEKK